jgi:23S rRNA pseudouridine2457 synthase
MASLIVFNKPFQVLSQFTDRDRPHAPRSTLADFLDAPEFRAAGRLDYDSEGLLLLTADGHWQQRIAHPQYRQWKTYWVQVEGNIDQTACDALAKGVLLRDGITQPARAQLMTEPEVWPRHPPIRERKTVSDSWLEIAITEGRNRQVRRMTAAVGFPTLRLIRAAIGPWQIDGLAPGEHRFASTDDVKR